jgi:predicted nucleic-acid-binding Zn-ribbon protein
MPSDQAVVYCKNCKKITLHIKKRINHILHLLLSIITFGVWFFIWLLIALFTSDAAQCSKCGYKEGFFRN